MNWPGEAKVGPEIELELESRCAVVDIAAA